MPGHRRSRKRLRDVSLGTYLTKRYGRQIRGGIDRAAGWASNLAGKVGEFLGMGDYEVRGNSLLRFGGDLAQEAVITPQGPRAISVKYKEYLTDVFTGDEVAGTGQSGFFLSSYLINPGISSTFPWLSPIAQQYEQWQPNGIVFEFRSTASSYATNTVLGRVVMATDYDVYDSNYSNLVEMLQSAFSNERKLDTPRIVHGIECDPADTPNRIFYVTQTGNTSGVQGSAREYFLGNFQIATIGAPIFRANIGSLYIHYDIALRKEQLYNGLPLKGAMSSMYRWGTAGGGGAIWPMQFAADDAIPLGVWNSVNDLGLTVTKLSSENLLIAFPPWVNNGTFMIMVFYQASPVSAVPVTGQIPYAGLVDMERPGPPGLQMGTNDYGTAAGDARQFSWGNLALTTLGRWSGIFNVIGPRAQCVLQSGTLISNATTDIVTSTLVVTQVSGRTFGGN